MSEEEKKTLFETSKRIGYKVGIYCNEDEIEIFKKLLKDYKYKNNLIQKQQVELEKKDEKLEEWKMEYNHWCQLAIDRKKQLEKKDKIINRMTNWIFDNAMDINYMYENTGYVGTDELKKERIKQYFKYLAEKRD